MLKKRQRQFLNHYLYDKETKANATKSAIKAGYSEARAASQGCQLLKNKTISTEIERVEAAERESFKKTKDEAVIEARKNYNEAGSPMMKKFWWEQWTGLQGWQVQKTESRSSVEVTEKQEQTIAEIVRKQMQVPN